MFLLLYGCHAITETPITEFCYWNEALLLLSSGPFVMLEYGKLSSKQRIGASQFVDQWLVFKNHAFGDNSFMF